MSKYKLIKYYYYYYYNLSLYVFVNMPTLRICFSGLPGRRMLPQHAGTQCVVDIIVVVVVVVVVVVALCLC